MKFKPFGILSALFLLTCNACSTTNAIKYPDPVTGGYWLYDKSVYDVPNADKGVEVKPYTYVSPSGERFDGVFTTSGFYQTSRPNLRVALVSICPNYYRSTGCYHANRVAMIDESGKLLTQYREYAFLDFNAHEDSIKPRDDDEYTTPFWRNYDADDANKIEQAMPTSLLVTKLGPELYYGYLANDGSVKTPAKLQVASRLDSNDHGVAVTEDRKFVNIESGYVEPSKYTCAHHPFHGGPFYYVSTDAQVLNYETEVQLQQARANGYDIYTSIEMDKLTEDNPATACEGGNHWGITDRNFKEIIPPVYRDIYSTSNGNFIVTTGGSYGYFDASGKVIIEPVYPEIRVGTFGSAIYYSGKWAICPASNCEFKTDFIYEDPHFDFEINDGSTLRLVTSEYALLKKNGKYGYVSLRSGLEEGSFDIDSITERKLNNGQKLYIFTQNNLYGIANNNQIIYPAKFKTIGYIDDHGQTEAILPNGQKVRLDIFAPPARHHTPGRRY